MGYAKDYDGGGSFNINSGYSWHHICYTYDGSKVRNFVNGADNWSYTVSLNTGGDKARIGNHNAANTLSPNAYLDEFRVYNRVLSGAEMATLRCQPFLNVGALCPF